jgi:hypothetical protein
MRRQRPLAGLGARGPVRPPRRGTIASPAPQVLPWSPAVQDWLGFLARLLAEVATEERAVTAPEERDPHS